MECKTYPFNTLKKYIYSDIVALYNGKWIFCKHKDRNTWEHPAGHIEIGETPLDAAKRELYEETGAIDFDVEPLCDYYFKADVSWEKYNGNGQVYFAIVHKLGELPHYSEIEKIGFFDALPDELTYPVFSDFYSIILKKRHAIV